MVEKNYRCDLCRKGYPEQNANLVGFEWKGTATGTEISFAKPSKVEHHVCADCLAGMVSLAREAMRNGHPVDTKLLK